MNPQVAVRLFNVAPTQVGSEVQHQDMSEASTPLIEIQACAACPLSVDAQNAQESKLQELIIMSARHYKPFMLDGGSTKSEGKGILLCECQ